jgi:alpha-galactosidase
VHAPDRSGWFTRDYAPDWKPADFTGADLCLGCPAACAWCLAMLDRLVGEDKLDMLEHDQRTIVDTCTRTDHLHTASPTDVAYRAALGYFGVYDSLRRRHPGLLFEDCVNGGRTVDYGILRRTHYVSITDVYDPLSNRRAFYDASYPLPPSMCECYVEDTHPATDVPFLTMLRSGMMGWCTIMSDTTRWTMHQHGLARRQFALYKEWLRPLIAHGNLYHAGPRPDGIRWDGVEYTDESGSLVALIAFRGTTGETRHTFALRGLDPASSYVIAEEDGGAPPRVAPGRVLLHDGLTVGLAEPGASQIVHLVRSITDGR